MESFADDIENAWNTDKITVVDGDIWIIFDGFDGYGYGQSYVNGITISKDGINKAVHVGRTLSVSNAFTSDPDKVGNNAIKHNIAHNSLVDHSDGIYQTENGSITDVSPIAQACVLDENGNPDTCVSGSDDPPPEFCENKEQSPKYLFCAGCSNWCRHTLSYSECTKDTVDSNLPR